MQEESNENEDWNKSLQNLKHHFFLMAPIRDLTAKVVNVVEATRNLGSYTLSSYLTEFLQIEMRYLCFKY